LEAEVVIDKHSLRNKSFMLFSTIAGRVNSLAAVQHCRCHITTLGHRRTSGSRCLSPGPASCNWVIVPCQPVKCWTLLKLLKLLFLAFFVVCLFNWGLQVCMCVHAIQTFTFLSLTPVCSRHTDVMIFFTYIIFLSAFWFLVTSHLQLGLPTTVRLICVIYWEKNLSENSNTARLMPKTHGVDLMSRNCHRFSVDVFSLVLITNFSAPSHRKRT